MSSTGNITSLRNGAAGGRASEVKGLKILKSPAEGGSKKDHEDFFDSISGHVAINWDGGKDIVQLIKNTAEPEIAEPKEISQDDEKSKLKMMMWKIEVEKYCNRVGYSRLSWMEFQKSLGQN